MNLASCFPSLVAIYNNATLHCWGWRKRTPMFCHKLPALLLGLALAAPSWDPAWAPQISRMLDQDQTKAWKKFKHHMATVPREQVPSPLP